MMDESDEDFKELCSSFFQRVKKNATKEVPREKKAQKASNNMQIRSKLKTKQVDTKGKTLQDPSEKKPQSGGQAPRTKKQGTIKSQASEMAFTVNGEGGMLAPAPNQPELWERVQTTQTETTPNSDSQPPPSCLATVVPSPSKPRTAELVLQRMQQFKRADPKRLKHASEECSHEVALEEHAPEGPLKETVLGNGYGSGLPATESDAAVALALQQEFAQGGASAHNDSLEEKGLFFCQICQKDLSAMNVARREQHVNRCLDEAEKALRPSMPQIPECPICGKPFLTLKSRISHLKQCAVKMEVGPQLLLQAVRLQTAQPEGAGSPPASSFSNHVGGLKRKVANNKKETRKKRKVVEAPSEDLLVAMALSRSEMEQCPSVPALKLESAFSEKIRPGAEKKSHKKKTLVPLPRLLVQDSETTGRQIEDRVALLLSEEAELFSTPPLPASRILKEELEKGGWCLPPPEGKRNFLWEGSTLTGAWAVESFYTASLVPPLMPQRPVMGLPLPAEQSELGMGRPPALHSNAPVGCSPEYPSPSASQREHQALQDLVDLAREGLSASPWPGSGGLANSGGTAGLELVPSGLPLTGFVLPPKEKHLERGSYASLSLGLLVADFGAMVNNSHLSDVQFQTDSGETLHAHKFVLYARCPLLSQYVNNEGFSAVEEGILTQRVLLNDVSTEGAYAFLHYLYTADTGLPPHLTPELRSLALRFGMSELAHLCEQVPTMTDSEGEQWEKEDENCESRAENFQELLRSVWVDEDEEAEMLKSNSHKEDREKVNEAEMEEIYEFAATQRKLLQGSRTPDDNEDTDHHKEDRPISGHVLASVQVNEQLEKAENMESSEPGRDEDPTNGGDKRECVLWPLQSHPSDREGGAETHEQEAPMKAQGCSRSCSLSVSYPLPHLEDTREHKQLFSSTLGEFSELSQITCDSKEQSGSVRERSMEILHDPAAQQVPLAHTRGFLSQLPHGGSPSQSPLHPHHPSGLSPSIPQLHGGLSQLATPNSLSPAGLSKLKRNSNVLTLFKEPGHQKGKECSSVLEPQSKGVLISPEKSLSIDLTQIKPDHLSPRSQNSLSSVNKEDEIILLLDSDEELELEQTKMKSVSRDLPEERKVLDISLKSSELFSVIDVDTDQEHSHSPPRGEAELQQERREGHLEKRGSVGSRGTPWLFCNRESSPDEDSTMDTSWLVPATPLASRSCNSSSQTQITSLRTRIAVDEMTRHMAAASSENREVKEATQELSVIMPQALSSCRVPSTLGTSQSRRQVHRSFPFPHLRHQKVSPLIPWSISEDHVHLTRPFPQGISYSQPGLRLPKQATASEVVEVEDSEDEQEVALCQPYSSPPLDSDPRVPADDCCWPVEPLSPIPIDHVNLERTGPLSTSSPSNRVRDAFDSSDSHSPGLLGTTPIRGSCATQRKSPEKSSQASSPGSSRLSFLNSALWADWDGEEQKSPEALPLTKTPSVDPAQKSKESSTPRGANQKKNLPPKVPITPMPQYSIMETPVLKKELDRFGVRPLPKRQMVLKLKEIFQYTHQTLESNSEDEIQSSQVPLEVPPSRTHTSATHKPSREANLGPVPQRSKQPAKTKGPRCRKQQPCGLLNRSPAKESLPHPSGDTPLPASQESVTTSVDGSDSSFSSQSSSSCEFGAAFESASENEEHEEGLSASQAAIQAADTEEAVRRFIRSRPALYRKVLLYQPFELGELQAELKQNGICMATGKLLDFLDAHCITFTTAAARKEKLQGKRRHPVGKKKGEQN
ncbi:structure-specific endonuclease subunit SLX4 [Nycticebus coucang]|uniref:structure-specific endonuclease subunit SLX4 n=1 Tax=Nycticebus coucang TaxID=9470 RepID=UPI00234D5952|nr:structure-specific endonuclease subunit SLX4 [Nycticebus coucang]XP_053411295.1 structure-specific endonuclease subunit SLX4 [Nycticebus coucang]XP_053411296.1 structure-specific endonuclease subunit SLX4 [Nycticebus coucang]XP_053411297.1 structure-specific endonuclease subunit SLX4 [Nycticebus coucang]